MILECETKYPILLVHGVGFRDRRRLNYWGRIPGVLEKRGADVYYGHQDSHGSIENNAEQIRQSLEQALEKSGSDKVNIIAHSKGGLDSRYLISRLGMSKNVASLTTIATPHHGSRTVDWLLGLPKPLITVVSFFSNVWYRLLGDKRPDSDTLFHQFSTSFAEEFNQKTADCSGVYYQSYAFVMNHAVSDFFLTIPYLFVKHFEGVSDGLVTPASAAWTNFRGTIKSASNRGISHCDEVDMRRSRFTRAETDSGISDITRFYIEVVSELKSYGL